MLRDNRDLPPQSPECVETSHLELVMNLSPLTGLGLKSVQNCASSNIRMHQHTGMRGHSPVQIASKMKNEIQKKKQDDTAGSLAKTWSLSD